MLIGVIQEKTVEDITNCLSSLPDYFDLIELRLDACEEIYGNILENLDFPRPVIVTLRPLDQGGAFTGSEQSRLQLLYELAHSNPDYIDLEHTVTPEWVEKIRKASPGMKIIISHHDFEKTPENLSEIIEEMKKTAKGATYKLATMAHSSLDALRMLVFCKESTDPIIGICMGEDGITTRILAPLVHTGFCYCPITRVSAPGQLDAMTLCDLYDFKSLNRKTRIYGLLGDPAQKSIGHLFHNLRNKQEGHNAIYVKWRVSSLELAEAVSLLRRLKVSGLSITMPLKELIVPLADAVDQDTEAIGALNTIVSEKKKWVGHNTDAKAAIKALPSSPKKRKVVVLGAGGAAKAILHELKKHTSEILVLNRSIDKAQALGVRVLPLQALERLAVDEGYDFLINTLPPEVDLPLTADSFKPNAVVMDITYIADSIFLRQARQFGCLCIDGIAMFHEQALLQRQLWGLKSN